MHKKSLLKSSIAIFVILVLMGATIPKTKDRMDFDVNDAKLLAKVDSTMATMSIEEKIGQLFMIAVWSEWQDAKLAQIYQEAEQYYIGGVCFFAGPAKRQAQITNRLNTKAKIPMLVGVDGEWGLGMRVTNAHSFPYAMNIGAVRDTALVREMGRQIGKHCQRLGVHINFAPVHDLNSNPLNPVINYRSFGSGTENVSEKCEAYVQGMQQQGVLAVAKHFPGHGDTRTDSHHALPVINKSRAQFEAQEMKPFQAAMDHGLQAMMIGHLSVPQLAGQNLPASLNPEIIYGIVKQDMGFDGLIVSDALNMNAVAQGVENHYLKAFQAGNDILLFPASLEEGVRQIKAGLNNGQINAVELDERCRRVLTYKYALGVDGKVIDVEHLKEDLNPVESKVLNEELIQKSLTLVRNVSGALPLKDLGEHKVAAVSINSTGATFLNTLKKYAKIDTYHSALSSDEQVEQLLRDLSMYDVVIVGLHGAQKTQGSNYGIDDLDIKFLKLLSEQTVVHAVLMANPYALRNMSSETFVQLESLLLTYGDSHIIQSFAAQAIMGGIGVSGRLSLNVNNYLQEGVSYTTSASRLGYTEVPESVGMSRQVLMGIDTIVDEMISEKMAPGCQVLVARKGKVLWSKAYGFFTYNNKRRVKQSDLYDLASVTKIAATVPLIMQQKDAGAINLNTSIDKYLPELKQYDKANLTLKQILLHQSGLESYIGFDFKLIDEDNLEGDLFHKGYTTQYSIKLTPGIYMTNRFSYREGYLSDTASLHYDTQVAQDLYTFSAYKQEMYHMIDTLPLRDNKRYQYSDLGFYYAMRVLEAITKQTIDVLASDHIYTPLGMNYTMYNPLKKINKEDITPTVDEVFFRKQLLQGYVHDQGAALMGGVGGHAGLFSNANDLAKLLQMYLNDGFYGGENYILPQTVKYFTQHTEHNFRRAVGFDKPETHPDRPQPTCVSTPPCAFGHTGFTGTGVWADPDNDLIYIFLSNRVHPHPYDNKFSKADIRPRIQQVIYNAIQE